MRTTMPEQGDLFAPQQLDLFYEESPRTSGGFAMPDGATSDQPADFTAAQEGIATP